MEDWLKGDFDDEGTSQKLLSGLLTKLVQNSLVDPVAGNPNSLMSKMTRADYVLGGEGPFLHGAERLERAPDQTGISLDLGYAGANGLDVQSDDLHIDHPFNLRVDQNLSILVSVPLGVTWTNNQWSLMASAGVGAQYRVSERWSLTPMVRVGMVGSLDVGAAAMMYSASLTSHAELPIADWFESFRGIRMGITKQFGFAKTVDDLQIGDYEIDYNLTNYALRNSAYLAGSLAPETPWAWKVCCPIRWKRWSSRCNACGSGFGGWRARWSGSCLSTGCGAPTSPSSTGFWRSTWKRCCRLCTPPRWAR